MTINIEFFFKVFKNFLRKTKGQKRIFIFFGIINMIITNLFLQFFLRNSFISTSSATLWSQAINMFLGYFLYSKLVFKSQNIFLKKFIFKYFLLMSIIWLTNFYFIELLEFAGFTRNIAALIIVPLLAFISFIAQRYLIFKN